jgi:hypothetical protein
VQQSAFGQGVNRALKPADAEKQATAPSSVTGGLMMESYVIKTTNVKAGFKKVSFGASWACVEGGPMSMIGVFEPLKNLRKEVKATGRPS